MNKLNKEQYAVYEKVPAHGKDVNGIILAPFNSKEEAEEARQKYENYKSHPSIKAPLNN